MTASPIASLNPLKFTPAAKKTKIKEASLTAFANNWLSQQSLSEPLLYAEFLAKFEAAICVFFDARFQLKQSVARDLLIANSFDIFFAGHGRVKWPMVRKVTP